MGREDAAPVFDYGVASSIFDEEIAMATLQELRTALSTQYPGTEARIKLSLTNVGLINAELAKSRASLHTDALSVFASNRLLHNSRIECAWLIVKVP